MSNGPQEPRKESWRTVYYKTASGRVPVREFIEKQDARSQERIRADFGRLRRFGSALGFPYIRKLEGRDFWELRTRVGGDAYRTFYFAYSGRKFVLLHAFQKKSQKTPEKELDTAESRMNDYIERDVRSSRDSRSTNRRKR